MRLAVEMERVRREPPTCQEGRKAADCSPSTERGSAAQSGGFIYSPASLENGRALSKL